MSDIVNPVWCQCGNAAQFVVTPRRTGDVTDEPLGHVGCVVCGIRTGERQARYVAVPEWNRFMGRRADATIIALRDENARLTAERDEARAGWEGASELLVAAVDDYNTEHDALTALRQHVVEWHAARNATLAEPVADVRKSEAFRDALNRLSNAEDALAAGARALINEIKEAKDGK